MADAVVIMSDTAPVIRSRNPKRLTTENSVYLRKIEELANEKLRFFRDKELREQETNKSNPKSVRTSWKKKKISKSKRPPSTGEASSKKRKLPKKADDRPKKPVVVNEITEGLKEFIVNEMKGRDVRLVIQKKLFDSDTRHGLNRLNMPLKQLQTNEFLTQDEKDHLKKEKGNQIEVRLLGPTLEMYKDPMSLRWWPMEKTDNYVFATNWYRFWSENKLHLKRDSNVQVWSFRGSDQMLCFAVVCVEEPVVEVVDSDS
ncbi:putative DNA-binding pseudobarrel domain superfamily [Helianthus annuus]|nr:putative DNA-binding pseudobarrel domain superfamily [Helianthus annuus]KAJ0646506.1 putative DNA-binding pseudobarrel domain superfamily [Helianthus annuus]KAJ0823209.1 putative DNA-binding pseudobarrel domain superfamily [Helianthus annuus]